MQTKIHSLQMSSPSLTPNFPEEDCRSPLTHYLIDTENVTRDWMLSVLKSESDCEYHIFFTENSPPMPLEIVKCMISKHDHLDFIMCHTGSNALDFQLVSWLGYQLAQHPKDRYQIVSGDTGFDSVVHFWKERGMYVSRITEITSTQIVKNTPDLASLFSTTLSGIVNQDEIGQILPIIERILAPKAKNYKSNLHTKLVQTFGMQKGRMIYIACRAVIEQIYSE